MSPATERASVSPKIVEARALQKSFGATRALVDGTLNVSAGEVIALLGENGSGKSTLVKVLSGALAPDSGEVLVAGSRMRFGSPRAAIDCGIVTVFQEILVASETSLLDNIWLGNGSPNRSRARQARRARRAAEIWATLSDEQPNFNSPIGQLPLMTQQVCVIVRALLRDPTLLILDESTSTLDVSLRDRLFSAVRQRTAAGMGCLFISHRMDEVMSFADRYVTLRNGAVTGVRMRGETDSRELIRLVSGHDERTTATTVATSVAAMTGHPSIVLNEVRLRSGSLPFSAVASRGEIVGLAGLEGHGQEELLKAMAGLHKQWGGSVMLAGRDDSAPRHVQGYAGSVSRGVVYVPRDRKVEGIADARPISENYAMPTYGRDRVFGWLGRRRTHRRLGLDGERVNFHGDARANVGTLSGGNQQKVVLARWLAANPSVVLLNDPTRGVDTKTKHELYEVFRTLAAGGATVVLLSSEVDELLHLVDRVLVFHDGSLSAELVGDAISTENLVGAYFGVVRVVHGTPGEGTNG
ncbi:MAG: ribose transport system ATP-binding protein [Actinomycetota bacterium]|nr:ribose transport system ATP-binding protein [Actinomycetota bacterium]